MLPRLRAPLACATIALCSCGVSACGSGSPGTGRSGTEAHGVSRVVPSSSERDTDGDVDSHGQGPYDTDNDANFAFGPAASPAVRRAVLALVARYYAAAAADQPRPACAMLDPLLEETVVEERSEERRSPARRESVCMRTLSVLLRQRHRELVQDVAVSHAIAVQVKGNRAVALMRFAGTRERRVPVRRTGASWKMDALLDGGSP